MRRPFGTTITGIAIAVAAECALPRLVLAQVAVAVPARAAEPAQISVVGNDYAFIQLPETLAKGPTLFSFENRGVMRHELSIALLKPGVTLAQWMSLAPGKRNTRETVESIIGILIARPGESSGGKLFADLKPGRTYIVICMLRDAPDEPPHIDMGMLGSFGVR